jgi:hypothetical protein
MGCVGIHCPDAWSVDIEELFMTKDEALDLALEALETGQNHGVAIDKLRRYIKQARSAPVQEPSYETLWHKVWPDAGSFVRASADDLRKFARSVATPPAQPAPVQEPVAWTAREIELIDGMIRVQMDHAERCDHIGNRTMAERQKGWDMERVALLQKVRATPPAAQRSWVGLTTEDILNLGAGIVNFEYAKAIEAKLKEKNT